MKVLLVLLLTPLAILVLLSNYLTAWVAKMPAPAAVLTPVPLSSPAGPPTAPVPVVIGTPAPVTDRVQQMISFAMGWLSPHVPYLWGGCSRHGVDCSCFVKNAYATIGINVPRTTVTQIAYDRPVSRDDVRPGDTVFFDNTCEDCGANPTHEGLYIGAGKMIEAGDPVQIADVFTGFYGAHYHGAGRPPGL